MHIGPVEIRRSALSIAGRATNGPNSAGIKMTWLDASCALSRAGGALWRAGVYDKIDFIFIVALDGNWVREENTK